MKMNKMLPLVALAFASCVNGDFRFHEIEVSSRIAVGATFDTPELRDGADVHFQAHLAVSNPGDGELEHPLGEFDRWIELAPGGGAVTDNERILLVPLHRGEGVVVYAWLDVDGDGVLCAPGAEPEPSGLIEIEDFPVFTAEVDLLLDQECKGPEALYP